MSLPKVIRAVAVAACLGGGSSATAATNLDAGAGANEILSNAIDDYCKFQENRVASSFHLHVSR